MGVYAQTPLKSPLFAGKRVACSARRLDRESPVSMRNTGHLGRPTSTPHNRLVPGSSPGGPIAPCDSEDLRGLTLAGPNTGSYALVERVRCEVGPAWPADCPGLLINSDFGKALGGHGALEHRASQTVEST